MTFLRFLDVSYALLLAEFQRVTGDILSAAEKVDQALGKAVPATASPTPAPRHQNDQALAALQARLSQVQGGPKKRTPRRA